MGTVSNVSTGKPGVAGAVYVQESASAALPTSVTAEKPSGFKDLGYVSDAGVVNSNAITSNSIQAWGGDTVISTETAKTDTFAFTLIEAKNADVLAEIYAGDGNVATADGTTTVKATSAVHEAKKWVIDMIMTDDTLKRICIPAGTITSVGDVTYADNSAIGYNITITCAPDENGVTHYEYIK